jgi:serine phosphatase RsbU (regulator of sigma subunit)
MKINYINGMKFKLFAILFFIICFKLTTISQNITVSGHVYGMLSDNDLALKKINKNVNFGGAIKGVKILVKGVNSESYVYSDVTGAYSFVLPEKGIYVIDYSKSGYSTVWFLLKYEGSGQKTKFPVTSFILKKEDNSVNDIGEMAIKDDGSLIFKPSTSSQKRMNMDVFAANKLLLEKCIEINNSSKQNIERSNFTQKIQLLGLEGQENSEETVDLIQFKQTQDSIAKQIIQSVNAINTDSTSSIVNIKQQIENSKKALAFLDPKSEIYKLLMAQISNAESQIQVKQALIDAQQNELSNFKKMLTALVLFAICAIAAALLLYVFFREKKKNNLILDAKNKEISKINTKVFSSIKYASIIQTNFFKEKKSLLKLFPQSFIYNQPKDMLSGDFYWFGQKNGHKIVAVADCTGHGVPGALLTMLGHTVLEEIVNVQGQVLPSKILFELNKAIVGAFSNQNQVEYGIDITVISIKDGSNELVFSGITNGPFIFSDGKLTHYKVTAKTIGLTITEQDLKDQYVTVKSDDCVYLMSDGFCDQFGKRTDKIEKFNLNRMEDLLVKASGSVRFNETEVELNTEFKNWKGDRDQTDDVLVLGFKI